MSNQKGTTKTGSGRKKTKIGIAREEAMAAGLKHFNGSVCSVDPRHGTIRRVENNTCLQCAIQHGKDRRERDRLNRPAKQPKGRVNMNDPAAFRHRVMVLGNPDRVRAAA